MIFINLDLLAYLFYFFILLMKQTIIWLVSTILAVLYIITGITITGIRILWDITVNPIEMGTSSRIGEIHL